MSSLTVLLAAAMVAGCIAGESGGGEAKTTAAAPPAPPPTPGVETGSLAGLVVTGEQQPIANARVALVEPALEATSDEAGKFTINEVAPGTYQVLVERLGFKTTGRKADIIAGEITELTFVLDPIVVEREWIQVEKRTQGVVTGNYVFAYPNDVQTWSYTWKLKDKPQFMKDMLFEVFWSPSTPMGDGVRFWSGITTATGPALCVGSGFNPYTCRVPQDKLTQEWPCDPNNEDDECSAGWIFRPGGSRAAQGYVGLWPSETINVYVSHFYRSPMPENYQARPPA